MSGTYILDGVETPAPAEVLAAVPDATAAAVPAGVTNFQARVALRHAGLFDAAASAVESMAADMDIAGDHLGGATLREAWERASFLRASPLVASLGAALGVTDEQMDELFRAADAVAV